MEEPHEESQARQVRCLRKEYQGMTRAGCTVIARLMDNSNLVRFCGWPDGWEESSTKIQLCLTMLLPPDIILASALPAFMLEFINLVLPHMYMAVSELKIRANEFVIK